MALAGETGIPERRATHIVLSVLYRVAPGVLDALTIVGRRPQCAGFEFRQAQPALASRPRRWLKGAEQKHPRGAKSGVDPDLHRESAIDSVYLDGAHELHVVPLVVPVHPFFAA